jgi:hypothetical protein
MSHRTAAPAAAPTSANKATSSPIIRFARPSRALAALTVAMLASAGLAGAQNPAMHPSTLSRFTFIVSDGALLPTGDQRDALRNARMNLAQLSYAVRPYLAVTTSLGWARTRDIAAVSAPKLDVFTYDVGTELRADRWLSGHALTFTPFAGAGAGGRSYNYRSLDVGATNNLAAYGSAGGELGFRRIRFRIEARNYVTGFKPLQANGASDRRNDVSLMGGFRLAAR